MGVGTVCLEGEMNMVRHALITAGAIVLLLYLVSTIAIDEHIAVILGVITMFMLFSSEKGN